MLETKELVPLIFDKVFKAVFIKEEDILIKMIRDIFEVNEKSRPFTMVGFETVPPTEDGKTYRGDILIKLSDKSYVSIEMNSVFKEDIFNRNFIHLIRVHNQVLKEGESNKEISMYRMRQLNLNLEDTFDDQIVSRYAFCNMDNNKVASLIYTICNINIAKGEELLYNIDVRDLPKAVRWGAILNRRSIEEIEYLIGDDLLTMEEKERLINTIKDVNNDENIIPAWIFEENARLKREQEMEFAFEDGEEKGIKEVIINMLKEQVDYNIISKVTGKTLDEIKEIENKI